MGRAWLFDSALNATDEEDAAPVRTISKPNFVRASSVWHHQRNLFHLKLGPDAAGFIFSSGIQEAEWKVSRISSPEEHPSPSLATSHGWEMRRGGFLLTFTPTAHFVLHLLLAPSSLIQLIKKARMVCCWLQ